ncbi:MAG: alpha/beta hydrolase [Alphaproteobacteria bacterium]|nr:alpha/beta hydrolase [Alphaproteobacteria bacterium]MBU0888796.1 alpha/beta hydrolase [Alphaproteobacteria bacterium]MBU1812485.1 alpha/beta hydrolase [Alphaproteobacteria bacterium]MBU2091516.1 alpha/beta hydrolase [Alphaproteobacteria bacterium]
MAEWHAPPVPVPPGTPTLVFLHEALGSIRLWRDFPAALVAATGLPALVYERPGHGCSDPLSLPRGKEYLHIEAEQVLPQVLAAAGVDRPLLVGHSDGGSIALLYAAAFPDRAVAVITEAAHVFVEDVTVAGVRQATELYRTTDLPQRLAKYHGSNTDILYRAWAETWTSEAFRDWNIEDRLPRITCPLLVLQGQDDEYATLRQVDAICTGSGGPATPLAIPDCAHEPHRQQRAAVLAAMTDFVARVG